MSGHLIRIGIQPRIQCAIETRSFEECYRRPNRLRAACRWRRGVGKGAKTRLGGGFTWNSGENHAREPEIGMVKNIEKLDVEAHFCTLGQRKPLRHVEVAPDKIGTTQRIAAEGSELTILRTVAP